MICERCHVSFKQKSNFLRHLRRKSPCDPLHSSKTPEEILKEIVVRPYKRSFTNLNNDNALSRIEALLEKIYALMATPSIPVCEFRNENLESITEEYIIECFSSLDLCKLFTDIYCNKDYPENQCIRKKANALEFYEDGKWKTYTLEKGIEHIIYHIRSLITRKLLNKRSKVKQLLGDQYDDLNLRLCCMHDPIEPDYQTFRTHVLSLISSQT